MKYNFKAIESKWQKKWEEKKVFEVKEGSGKKKFYVLEMFPYPSGSGLHMGHAWNYSIGDILARFKIMKGFNVLHPMGYDALGLPAENAAIKDKVHPGDYTKKSTANFMKQQKILGLSYDWSRVVNTSKPDYYKWDQWIFLKMFEKGLAYKKKASVNWCPSCKTVLANEQAQTGKCERCGTEVEVKFLEQWFLKITDYADELLDEIDNLDWPFRTKAMQKNWIGRSEGTEIDFGINGGKWPIFTTRPDTLYGVTFMVISAQHPKLFDLVIKEQKKEVEKFLQKLGSISEKDLVEMGKEGVFTGSYAINPVTKEKVPVYAGNFVVADYGSGMVMAVPAHDQRDFEFAKKYGIKIKQVIEGKISDKRAYTEKGKLINSDKFNGMENEKAKKEITKYLVEKNLGRKVVQFKLRDWLISRQRYWGTPIPVVYCDSCKKKIEEKSLELSFYDQEMFSRLKSGGKTIETRALNPEEKSRYFGSVKKGDYLKCVNKITNEVIYLEVVGVNIYKNLESSFKDKQFLSKFFRKINSLEELKEGYKFTEDYLNRIEKKGLIAWDVELVTPGVVPIPEKDLPIELPKKVKFGEGNPLETNEVWIKTKCPKCGGKARRETDTMDTFVNSSWYFLRYCDPKNSKKIFDKKKVDYWCPIDVYIGGAEHACMHLIYFRFYTKFLADLGLLNFREPAKKLFHQGMLHAEGGQKMSKSKGIIVLPEDVSKDYGIDTARFFLCGLASPDKDINWDEKGIVGSLRFINKIFDYFVDVKFGKTSDKVEFKLNKTIENIEKYFETFEYRKASIEIRELFDLIEKENVSKDVFKKFLQLLNPICPHITEELWEKLGNKTFLSLEKWPEFSLKNIDKKFENSEKLVEKLKSDIVNIKKIVGKENAKVYIYVLPNEVELYKGIENVKVFTVNDKEKYDPENKSKKVKPGRPGIYLE